MFNGCLPGEIVKSPGLGHVKGPKSGFGAWDGCRGCIWLLAMGGICWYQAEGQSMLGTQVEREGGSLEWSQLSLSRDGGSWVSAHFAPEVVRVSPGANGDLSGLPQPA